MTFMTRMKMALIRFMQGRNGPDNLGWHALWGGLILGLLEIFFPPLGLVSTALYVYAVFRMLSRNVARRQEENRRYVAFTQNLSREVKQFFLRLKGMRTHKYFRCPGCRSRLRLRRGSGEKHITCPVCRHEFDQRA
jgi:hypothetical protein